MSRTTDLALGGVVVVVERVFDYDDGSTEHSELLTLQCVEAGVRLARREVHEVGQYGDGLLNLVDNVHDYSPPYLALPREPEVGMAWSGAFTVTSSDEDGEVFWTEEASFTGDIAGREDVSVEAGVFDALEVRYDWHGLVAPEVAWYDTEVGLVLTDVYELTEWAR